MNTARVAWVFLLVVGTLLVPHPVQHALGADGYRALLAEALSEDDLATLRLYLQQQRAYGRDAFRSPAYAQRIGRPRQSQSLKRDK